MSAGAKNEKSIRSRLMKFFNVLQSIFSTARSFLFAFYYPKFVDLVYNKKVVLFKRDVFADIDSVIPSDKEIGQIKILEIGVGPGFNLDFFPKQCRLIAVDKNLHFKNVLIQNLKKHPGIVLEKFINERGENMISVPANSIDVVVSSSIHCSVDNSQSVLKEINRVLVPGGRYYFFEHVLDEPDTKRYKWQMFVNKIRLWQLVGHGCIFADFDTKIAKFGLFEYKAKRYTFENNSWTYYPAYLIASHYGGCAFKET